MAQLSTSYDVYSGDDTTLAVPVTDTQTEGIVSPINRNGTDEAWATRTGCVVEVSQEIEGEKRVEFWGIGGGTVNADLSLTLTAADITRNISRTGANLAGTGTGQKFNVGARVRLVNHHYNFNQKLNTDRDDGMAEGKKLWFGSIANYIRALGSDIFIKDGNNPETSLSNILAAAGVDNKFRVSTNDTTSRTLDEKVVAGDGIKRTIGNAGGDETYTLDVDLKSAGGLAFESGQLKIDPTQVAVVPAGAMFMWLTNTEPTGYLLCYGQAVSRTTYSTLFGVIGTTFGSGDGSSTFNLPDLRGRVPLGQDDMGGSSANRVTHTNADTIGGVEGAESHTLSTDEIPAHSHAMNIKTGSGNSGNGNMALERSDISSSLGSSGGRVTADNTGGGAAHNNMQPYITVNYIIKT